MRSDAYGLVKRYTRSHTGASFSGFTGNGAVALTGEPPRFNKED